MKHITYAMISLSLIAFGVLFCAMWFPHFLKKQIIKNSRLVKGTELRQMWEKIPFGIDFEIFFFNYTNPEDVHNGATPIVKEVGPYFFEEWKEKIEVVDHEEDDSITFRRMDTWKFRQDLSKGLTGEELIILPHAFLVSIILGVEREKPQAMTIVSKAIDVIFENQKDIFLRARAMDLLFRGVTINCNHNAFAPKAVCMGIKAEAGDNLIYEPDDQYKFSLFGARNHTPQSNVFKVKRGLQNIKDVGKVVEIDGKLRETIWGSDECNEFSGTDSTVYPPFVYENDTFETYSAELCRSLRFKYVHKSSYAGIPTNRYRISFGDAATDPEARCFCDGPDKCPPKGIYDTYKCTRSPIQISLPHFLECDPKIQQGVKGLRPNATNHDTVIEFEPIAGNPIYAKSGIMMSIPLKSVDKVNLFKKLPECLAPLLWVREGIALNKTFTSRIKFGLVTVRKTVRNLKWLTIAAGSAGLVLSVYTYFKDPIHEFLKKNNLTYPEEVKKPEVIDVKKDLKIILVAPKTAEPLKVA